MARSLGTLLELGRSMTRLLAFRLFFVGSKIFLRALVATERPARVAAQ
jgi:hypothetical protein